MTAPLAPEGRPVEGLVVGLVIGVATAVTAWAVLIVWLDGLDTLRAHPWAWGATSLTWLSAIAGLPPVPPANPVEAWPAGAFMAIGWRVCASLVTGLIAGFVTGIRAGAAPSAERYVSGRRVVDSPSEYARALNRREKANGVYIHPAVRLSLMRESLHFLMVGGSGSGKTQVIHRLIVSSAERSDQQLIYDFKGDLTSQYWNADAAVLIAPWDHRSVQWDIAADVPDIAAARELAAALIPLPETGDLKWATGSRQILTGQIVALQATRPGQWSIHDLAEAVSADGETLAATLREFFPEAAHLLMNPRENPAASYISSVIDYLGPVHDLARMWSRNTVERWSVRRWLDGRERPRVIVGHNQGQVEVASFILRAILRLVLQRVGAPEFTGTVAPTWLFLDEFPQAGKIDSLLSITETARSKNVRVVLACQDFSRVKDIYGRDLADALVGTLGTILIGRSRDETARWASRLAGEKQLDRYRASVGTNGKSTHWDRVSEPVMRPEAFDSALGTLGHGDELTNRLLMLAGGDVIGRIDWPLYRPPAIAEAHVPIPVEPSSESAYPTQPEAEPLNGIESKQEDEVEADDGLLDSDTDISSDAVFATNARIDTLRRLKSRRHLDWGTEAD